MADKEKKRFIQSVVAAVSFVAIMWIVELIEVFSGHSMMTWGIFPRAWDGVVGIVTSPFVHGDWGHLLSNTGPMLMLVTMVFYFYSKVAIPSIAIITLLTGSMVWMFARQSYHIGASGILYGLVSFLFWSGIFRKNTRAIVLALVVLSVYSGYFTGIVPDESKANVSWESHLSGGIAGIITAGLFKNTLENEERNLAPKPQEEEVRSYFLPRDVFAMTKYQRYLLELQRKQEMERKYRELQELRASMKSDDHKDV